MTVRRFCGALAATAFLLVPSLHAQKTGTVLGSGSCLEVVRSLGGPLRLPETVEPGGEAARRLDRVLLEAARRAQGSACALRFEDLFEGSDSAWVPLTSHLLAVVPEASLRGMALFDSSGRRLGIVERRMSLDTEPGFEPRDVLLPFHALVYRTPEGRAVSSGSRLLEGGLRMAWRDVARRWVLDVYSDGRTRFVAPAR